MTRSCACATRSAPTWHRIPVGIPEPLVVGRGINDVAIVALTLSPATMGRTPLDGGRPAPASCATACCPTSPRIEDVGLTYIVGGRATEIRVDPIPSGSRSTASRSSSSSARCRGPTAPTRRACCATGATARRRPERRCAACPMRGEPAADRRDGRPVYVRDVADVSLRTRPTERGCGASPAPDRPANGTARPAVTLAIAKRAGANAVDITQASPRASRR
jgi:hypothetical protein